MAKGGARPGAGRPAGSTTRPQLRNYFTDDDIAQLVADLKERARTDSTILKFLGEQVFGKAPQPLTGEGGIGPVQVQISEAVAKKNNIGV